MTYSLAGMGKAEELRHGAYVQRIDVYALCSGACQSHHHPRKWLGLQSGTQ